MLLAANHSIVRMGVSAALAFTPRQLGRPSQQGHGREHLHEMGIPSQRGKTQGSCSYYCCKVYWAKAKHRGPTMKQWEDEIGATSYGAQTNCSTVESCIKLLKEKGAGSSSRIDWEKADSMVLEEQCSNDVVIKRPGFRFLEDADYKDEFGDLSSNGHAQKSGHFQGKFC